MSADRVAVFQADHPLQVHTTNVIKGLKASGYNADLFLYNCRYIYEGTETIDSVFDLSTKHVYWSDHEAQIARALEAFRYFIIGPLKIKDGALLPSEVFDESLKIAKAKKYRCLVGIEKLGFVWAASLAKCLNIPAIYYSLELYPTKNALNFLRNWTTALRVFRFLRLRSLEKSYHKKARATIIQDPRRAAELMKMNNVQKMENLFLPVSLAGPRIRKRTDYLRTALGIPDDKKIILQLGILEKNRSVEEVVRACQAFPDDWVLVFHGPVFDEQFAAKAKEMDRANRIIISRQIIPPDELDLLVSSADVGLCFYPKGHINDYLTGFSSEKLARYLRCGLPVVTFDYPTYLDSVGKNGCGVCVRDLSSLNKAISEILNDYENYRTRAYETFESHFEFNKQFEKIASYISQL